MKRRYTLRTLLLLMAIVPLLFAVGWWTYTAWKEEQDKTCAEAAAAVGATRFIQNQLLLMRSPPSLAPVTPATLAAEEAAFEAERQASRDIVEKIRKRVEDIPEAELMQRRGHPIFPAVREI